jgi:hypothetical protein
MLQLALLSLGALPGGIACDRLGNTTAICQAHLLLPMRCSAPARANIPMFGT